MANSRQPKKTNRPMSGAKIALITTLITALVGLVSTILVVFFQNVFPILINLKITQTAAVVGQTQTVEAETAMAPTPYPSVMPVMSYYANMDQANVYEQSNQSSRVFDTVVRCTKVEVVSGGYDPDWLHVTYLKGNVRYTGYVLTKQFTDVPCEPASISTP
jgi:uncharacterized protein YgiM (DUF1202 family)